MKGPVFTELMDRVEKQYGYAMCAAILQQAGSHGGSDTTVGAYPHEETPREIATSATFVLRLNPAAA
ncbi:MAG: heme NO-binding domain-containing protein [Acidobacteriota bacterium]